MRRVYYFVYKIQDRVIEQRTGGTEAKDSLERKKSGLDLSLMCL